MGELSIRTIQLENLLKQAACMGASDIHCSEGESPVVRIDGEMQWLDDARLSEHEGFVRQLAALVGSPWAECIMTRKQIDCACTLNGVGRFRVNIFHHSRGIAAAFRVIPDNVLPLDSLALPSVVAEFAGLDRGLVLITGPTGSGKSTTLAALVECINTRRKIHIVTVEDPIEFVYTQKRALIRQREVGLHTESFAQALRAVLREDPDVILIGELRDLETTQLALTAAETGHLVLASMHSTRAYTAVDRMIDLFPAQQQSQVRTMLAESLQGVVTQRLYPRAGGGRVAAVEILVATSAVRTLIREAKTHQLPGTMQVSRGVGMQTFEAHLEELGRQKLIRSF